MNKEYAIKIAEYYSEPLWIMQYFNNTEISGIQLDLSLGAAVTKAQYASDIFGNDIDRDSATEISRVKGHEGNWCYRLHVLSEKWKNASEDEMEQVHEEAKDMADELYGMLVMDDAKDKQKEELE